jgi:hypothetical protein
LHDQAQAKTQRLALQEQLLASRRSEAELWTFLRHPWPRSQVLRQLIAPLPATIALRHVRITREPVPRPAQATNPLPTSGAGSAAGANPAIALTAIQRDLLRLRDEVDGSQIVVILDATAESDADVHRYLAKLAAVPLFVRTDLTSIERLGTKSGNAVNFSARLVLHAAYGQPDGPAPQEAEQLARLQGAG